MQQPRFSRSLPITVSAAPTTEAGATNIRESKFYPSLWDALGAAQDGDDLSIAPFLYGNFAFTLRKTITMRSAVPGQRYQLAIGNPEWKGLELDIDVGLTIEDAEIYGNRTPDSIAAGIWPDGGAYTLIVRNCLIYECNNGIMAGEHPLGVIVVENTEVRDCGDGAGYTHNLYIGGVGSFTARGLYSHMTQQWGDPGVTLVSDGQLLKCRARQWLVEASRLSQERGNSNRCADFPNGGDGTFRGNLCELNPDNTQNEGTGQVISFGVEEQAIPERHPINRFLGYQNTIRNDATSLKNLIWVAGVVPSEYAWIDNVIAGPFGDLSKGDPTYAPSTDQNSIVALSALNDDYSLVQPTLGSQNWSPFAYKHPASHIARTDAFRGAVPA